MKNALEYARSVPGIVITKADENLIYQCRETYLFSNGSPWIKKEIGKEKFDVPMGSYDGAEVCELVGLYILHKLTRGKNPIFKNQEVGLYRDDGLSVFRGSARNAEKIIKPRVIKAFEEEGLSITIEHSAQITDFLDTELDLEKHIHRPFRKPNNTPLYINVNSNHPKSIIKQIPKNCAYRLSMLSSNKEIFDAEKGPYEKALKDSGHTETLEYIPPNTYTKKRVRRRKVMYYNAPFSKHIHTNVGRKFLKLVTHHFPTNHPLRKIFNRNTIKYSPCTLTNMKQHISKMNCKILNNKEDVQEKECDCKRKYKNNCPLQGRCQQKSVIYQADVHSNNQVKTYFGSTKNEFKTRFLQHMSSFNRRPLKSSTSLAKYVWQLNSKNIPYEIKWSIKAKAHAFSSGSKKCDLCISEKLVILKADPGTLINRRDEILEKCRHNGVFFLSSIKV